VSSSFGPIAPFYDQLMHQVPYGMWMSYYELLLITQEVHPRKYLDVCCGTGTCAEQLAAVGNAVAGIDLSAPMIEEARRKAELAGLQIRYEAMDAASFDLGESFEAAYSFFDSFNYITDLGRLGSAFKRVAAHLDPGGSFIFDLNTAYAFEKKMFDQEDTRKKTAVQYKWVGDYDATSRVIHVHMTFWVDGKEFREVHIQRAHREEEVIDLLLAANFTDIVVYDAYTLEPPRKKSDRVHVACRKL